MGVGSAPDKRPADARGVALLQKQLGEGGDAISVLLPEETPL